MAPVGSRPRRGRWRAGDYGYGYLHVTVQPTAFGTVHLRHRRMA